MGQYGGLALSKQRENRVSEKQREKEGNRGNQRETDAMIVRKTNNIRRYALCISLTRRECD